MGLNRVIVELGIMIVRFSSVTPQFDVIFHPDCIGIIRFYIIPLGIPFVGVQDETGTP